MSEYFKTKLTMRIFKTWSVLLILMLSIVYSCKDEGEVSYFLKLETAKGDKIADILHVEADGMSQTITVKSNGPWEIAPSSSKVDWVSIQPVRGNGDGSFILSVEKNETLASRETEFKGLLNSEEVVVLIIKQ